MSFHRIHESNSKNTHTSQNTSQFAPRPFPIDHNPQESGMPPTQEEIENEAFEQDKSEATRLQLKEKYGTIASAEQERLGVLQAKMDSFWIQRRERTKAQPNLLEILTRKGRATPATAPAVTIQPKLAIGQPNDQYEQEADRVAEQVISMAPPAASNVQRQTEEEEQGEIQTKPRAETITPMVQRFEASEEEELVQTKCEVCEGEEQIQRSPDSVAQSQPHLESRLNSSKDGGSPLSDDVRSFMEPRFGFNFSQVRVHTDSEAVQMNRELNAQAFTHGSHIYFGEGKAPAKDNLTAHEMTHVLQQTGGEQLQAKWFNLETHPITIANSQDGWVQRYPNHAGEVFLMTLADSVLKLGADEVKVGKKTSTELINEAFWMAYPEMKGKKIGDVSDPEQQKTYADAWNYIANLYKKVYKPKKKTDQSGAEDTESSLHSPWQDLNDIVNEANNQENKSFDPEVTYLSDERILDEIFRIEDFVNSSETDPSEKEELVDYQEQFEEELSARERVKKGLEKVNSDSGTKLSSEEVKNELIWIEKRLFGTKNNPDFLDKLLTYKEKLLQNTFQVEHKKIDNNFKKAYKLYKVYTEANSMLEMLAVEEELSNSLNEIGFSGIPEFEEFISQSKSNFENKTLEIVFDALAKHEKLLNKEEEKYQNNDNIEILYESLHGARERYQGTEDTRAYFRSAKIPPSSSPKLLEDESKAEAEVSNLANGHPLLRNQDFDRKELALAEQSEVQTIMLDYIENSREAIQDSRKRLEGSPELIYSLENLLKVSKEAQRIVPGFINDVIINEQVKDLEQQEAALDTLATVLAVVLTVISWEVGGIGGAVVATGSGMLGAYEAVDTYKDYATEKDFYTAGLDPDDPSIGWVVIAVVGAGADLAFVVKPVFNGLKVIKESGAIKNFTRLDDNLSKQEKLKNLDEELKALQPKEPSVDEQMRNKILKAADEEYTHRSNSILIGEKPGTHQPIIDPNTRRPVGEGPGTYQPIIDPNTGRPVGEGPGTYQPIIDPNTNRPGVVIKGISDAPHEANQANRFAQLKGGGEIEFLGDSSQGIEGFFRPQGSNSKIPLSLKDFTGTGKTRNILKRINANAQQVRAAGYAGDTILHASVRLDPQEMMEFIQNGPIAKMPSEGVFRELIFECNGGTVVVSSSGVKIV